jgi:biotin operon repressor
MTSLTKRQLILDAYADGEWHTARAVALAVGSTKDSVQTTIGDLRKLGHIFEAEHDVGPRSRGFRLGRKLSVQSKQQARAAR